MRALEIDDLLAVHRRLITRGVIAPLAEDDVEVRQWLDWELASLIEGHFHEIVEVGALSAAERAEWERRVTEGGLRDPRTDKWRRVYWLLHDGEPVGTLGLDVTRLGRPDVGLTSLYVRPDLRRHRIAAQALDEVFDAAVAGGATGLRLETSWSWQAAVRFYLALGFWVRNWKHALAFMRSTALCPYRVEMHGMQATFLVRIRDEWRPLLSARHCGSSLRWTELAGYTTLDDASFDLRYHAPGTFALHLAVAGWPLVRSPDFWARRHYWSDMGMPEGLAYKIARFEFIDRQRGYDVRTPRVPGLDYDTS